MRVLVVILCAALSWSAGGATPEELVACPVSQNLRGHEDIEWSIGYAFNLTNGKRNLPRVLLVGDSICNAYQDEVRKRLDGKMNVSYWVSSYCVTSPGYLRLLDFYLSEAEYAVVHFNNGCHSFGTPDADWEKGLRAALRLIRLRQPKAKIVWASTTPNGDEKNNARVKALNAVGEKVAAEEKLPVDDLYALMDPLDRATFWSDRYHFKPAAVLRQADQIARVLLMESPTSDGSGEVVLQAKPAKGHLQDVCFDGKGAIYWAHTREIYKTDLNGRVLAKVDVEGHHAGLEVRGNRLYVAICPMQGTTDGKTTIDCRVTVGEYDAETLALVKMHVTDINDRAGSLAILEDGTFLVGCLRPQDIAPSQVRFHHLDADFKLIKSHVLDNVPVKLGIEVIKRVGSDFFLNCYGTGADGKPLPFDTIRLDANFRETVRGKLGGATGLVFDGTSVWTGWTRFDKETKTYTSKIVRKPRPAWTQKAFLEN